MPLLPRQTVNILCREPAALFHRVAGFFCSTEKDKNRGKSTNFHWAVKTQRICSVSKKAGHSCKRAIPEDAKIVIV